MVDINGFKAECVRHNLDMEEVANKIGMSRGTLWRKLRGDSEFDRLEIQAVKDLLGLSGEQVLTIFFAD